jgi:hypothetical protein
VQRAARRREREVERIDDPGRSPAHPGDGLHGPHAGREQAVVVLVLALAEANLELGVEAGLAIDLNAERALPSALAALRPVRRHVLGRSVAVLDHDHVRAAHHADQLEAHAADAAWLDRARGRLDAPRRGRELAHLAHLVDLDAERVGHHGDGRAPAGPDRAGLLQAAGVAHGLAEPEQLAHVPRARRAPSRAGRWRWSR